MHVHACMSEREVGKQNMFDNCSLEEISRASVPACSCLPLH